MEKIDFKNLPDTSTPINSANLNLLQDNVEASIEELSNKNNYSTEEQVIGKWIDGKPLYRKMVDTGNMPSNSVIQFEHSIANVQHIHVNIGETMWTGNTHNFTKDTTNFSPIYADDSGMYIKQLAVNSSSIQIGTANVNAKYFKLLVCVEYTKTTD